MRRRRMRSVLGGLMIAAMAMGALPGRADPPSAPLAAETKILRLASSDPQLVKIFDWAKATSQGYVGQDSDPVGPWYEAALPGREAFCIRDVAHQCIGAEILGQGRQNRNMLRKFAENISETKDFCSYWEINRHNQPAPVDYTSDDDFWYNLNANFDILDACYKLYQWTGDKTYINDETFDRFFKLTLNEYVARWQLQADRIMDRPALMNLRAATNKHKLSRGIPSYDESQGGIAVSGDLLAMIANGFQTYSKILHTRNQAEPSTLYAQQAAKYRQLIEARWWDKTTQSYFAFYTTDKKFHTGGIAQSEFLLWYHAIEDPTRITKSLRDIRNSQVEVLTYLPMLYYRYGMNPEGYDYLGKIFADKRRAYPEASCAAIEAIVRGLMGVEPSAPDGRVTTCPRLTGATAWVTCENIPVLEGLVTVHHSSPTQTTFTNQSGQKRIWRAMFQGTFENIRVNGSALPARHQTDAVGNAHSYADIEVAPGAQAVAEAATGRKK